MARPGWNGRGYEIRGRGVIGCVFAAEHKQSSTGADACSFGGHLGAPRAARAFDHGLQLVDLSLRKTWAVRPFR